MIPFLTDMQNLALWQVAVVVLLVMLQLKVRRLSHRLDQLESPLSAPCMSVTRDLISRSAEQ